MGEGQVRSLQSSVDSPQSIVENRKSPIGEVERLPRQDLGAAVCNPWLVVRTKIKCEKFVRDQLQKMGMEAFVPVQRRTARYVRKVKTYENPLISCYTFVRFDAARRNQILALPYVQGFLRTDKKDCVVSEREMLWLQKISGTDLEVKTEILSMHIGERVVLAYGQLAGMEGTIVSRYSKHEVKVALESLGLQMVIQVEANMLERAM